MNQEVIFIWLTRSYGMFLTLLFVRYIVKDNISHGISRILYAISKKKSHLKTHNTGHRLWQAL